MSTAKFKTSGMHCPSCTMLIEMSVTEISGVQDVKVDRASEVTAVTFDSAVVSTDTIAKAIREAGYGAEIIG